MDQQQVEGLRKVLSDELAAIDRQLRDVGSEGAGESLEVDSDEGFADSAQATAERSSLLGLVEQLTQSRHEIVDALARIDAGTYGQCENCGQEIPYERLETLPSTRLCVTCKQKLSA